MIEPGQVAAMRRRLGLSQNELARRSGVSQSLIAKIETGKLDPTFSKLRAISDALANGAHAGRAITVGDVMARPVVSMFADETVATAIDHLARHGFSQLPVLDEGRLVGTVTDRGLLHYVGRHPGDAAALERPVRDVMTQALPLVPPDTEAAAVESLLDVFPGVLVAANGRVLGIVTRADVLGAAKAAPPKSNTT